MRTYCEFYVKVILPALRALIAKELVEKYSMSQMEAANVLGITQASINYYLHGKRCKKLVESIREIPEVREAVKVLSKAIVEGRAKVLLPTLCNLCNKIRSNEQYLNRVLKAAGISKDKIITI